MQNPDISGPVLLAAEVNANGNIELSFNETLDADNLPPLDSLVVTIGTAPDQTTVDVINIAADGNILTMITNPVITAGQSVSVENILNQPLEMMTMQFRTWQGMMPQALLQRIYPMEL